MSLVNSADKYVLLQGSVKDVERQVDDLLKVGWKLYGAPFISSMGTIYQAMVKTS